MHYGIAGNANPDLQIGDVTIPQYWAHTGLWNWQVLESYDFSFCNLSLHVLFFWFWDRKLISVRKPFSTISLAILMKKTEFGIGSRRIKESES